MKKWILMMALVAMLASCHSNEKNYRAAYDKAREKYESGIGKENYDRVQAERMRSTQVINGDSVRLLTFHTNIVDDTTAIRKRYSVIIASFSQKFNAISYRDRLRNEEGYESYVLYGGTSTSNRKYYVAVKGFDEKELAAAFVKRIDDYVRLRVLEPRAWILVTLR